MKKRTCHAEPVRSISNGPERSEGAQDKLREARRGGLFLVESKQKQIPRSARDDMTGGFFSSLPGATGSWRRPILTTAKPSFA